jgi:microcystin-dependent protein
MGDSAPIGSVHAWLSATAPANYLIADGSAISRSLYPGLYSLIGTTFGSGDGSTTFNIPDLRSRFVVGAGPGSGGLSQRLLAAIGGEENHVLAIAELAAHAHTLGGHTHSMQNHQHVCHTQGHNHGDSGHTHSYNHPLTSGPTWGGSGWTNAADTTGTGYASLAAAGDIGGVWSDGPNYASTAGPSGGSDNTGSGSGHNTMPPFICLVYIVKVSIGGGPTAQAPIANQTQAGLMNQLDGNPTSYVGGDNACHPATTLFSNARLNSYNALGNPNFEIDARTVGAGASTNGAFAQDRWQLQFAGGGITAKQMAGQVVIPGTTFPITQNYLRITLNTQDAAPAAGDFLQVLQFIEGIRIRELFGGPSYVTLLCRSSVAGLVFGVNLRDQPQAWTCTQTGTITNANQWTTIPIAAFPLFTASGTFPTTPGNNGVQLGICLMCGSTYSNTSNGIWINKNAVGAVGQSNFAAAPVGSTFDLAFIQHEPIAFTQFMDKKWDDNETECCRYFDKSYSYGTPAGTVVSGAPPYPGSFYFWNTSAVTYVLGWASYKRRLAKTVAPTIWNPVTGAINSINVGGGNQAANCSLYNESGFGQINFTTGVAGYGWSCYTVDTGW